MEFCHFLPSFLLSLTIFSIYVCSSFRIGDKNTKIERIPFIRVKPDVGFLQRTDIDFDREVRQFHARARRSVGDIKISHEFELKGDNHTVAFLHWAGKKSAVIYIYTCEKVTQTKSGHLNCENAYFWRSVDYGSTFKRDEGSIAPKSITISDVEFCPSNHKKIVISDVKNKMLYISKNEGSQYTSVSVRNFSPHVVSCNPASDKWLVSYDSDTNMLYYSSDGGQLWQTLREKVLQYYWAPKQFDSSQSTIFLEVQKAPYQSELWYAEIPFDFKTVKIFEEDLGSFLSYSLEVEGRYIFVQKDVSEGLRLFVFFKNGSSSSKNFFQKTLFPLNYIHQGYKILDASENEVLVSVKHKKFSNLYVSDVTGLKYSLSLENILMDRSSVWGQNTTMVDIHQVRGLNGIYLANVRIQNADGDKVRSVISFNKGGDWNVLRAPEKDHNGNPTNCKPPHCSLHIHIILSRHYYYIPSVLSSPSAVGLIIAQGNLGHHLGQGIGVFLSRDGGVTWTKEFDSFYDFMIGDHGGIITAVSMRADTTDIWYSCTEGKNWKNITLGSKPIHVFGIVTEPGETTLIFNVFGHYAGEKFRWLSVKLNFTSVLNHKCSSRNYTFWSPNDERSDDQCILGQHMVFERRKAEDCCFNGKEYERKFNITPCTCGAEDFDCDFGFKHPALDKECVATPEAVIVPDPCPEGKTYQHTHGYRKVSGDRCKGGVEDQLNPVTRWCPLKGPDELQLHLPASVNYTVARDAVITFELSQEKGSKLSTNYTWDFGDNTEVVNVTGFRNAKRQSHVFKKHGQFTVSVFAENKAGKAVDKMVISVVDVIARVQIKPPHAVVIGEEAVFSISLYNNHSQEESSAQHGYVHFMWFFDSVSRPVLTWDHEVAHTFYKPGKYHVSVKAISYVGNKDAHATITVYKVLTTVRLSFDKLLDMHNQRTDEWRASFSQRLQGSLVSLLQIKPSRLEVSVLYGLPTTADVSINPAPTNQSKTRLEIIELLKSDVSTGAAEVQLPGQITIRITHVEVLPDRGVIDETTTPFVDVVEKDNRLAVAIGISASLIVIFLVVILVYFFRRYNRLQSSYTRLRLASDGEQLRDPLIQNEDGAEDEGLHPQPGGSFRYVPVASQRKEVDSDDEELLDNFNPDPLYIMPGNDDDDTAPRNQNT